MDQIAEMTHHIVKKAKEYDHDTVPGDYATLRTPCPNCGGVVTENYRRYACIGTAGNGCGFSFGKNPGGRTFETRRGRAAADRQADRSARRVPLQGRLAVHGDDHSQVQRGRQELEARVRLRQRRRGHRRARGLFSVMSRSARARNAAGACSRQPSSYVCENAVRTDTRPEPTCDFKSRRVILQQPIEPAQMMKLLATGKTDLLEKFISNADAPSVQGLSGLGQGSGEGQLRVCSVEVSVSQTARGGAPRTRSGRGRPSAGETSARRRQDEQVSERRRAQGGSEVDRQAADAERRARYGRRQPSLWPAQK